VVAVFLEASSTMEATAEEEATTLRASGTGRPTTEVVVEATEEDQQGMASSAKRQQDSRGDFDFDFNLSASSKEGLGIEVKVRDLF